MFIYGLFKHSHKIHSDVDSFDDCHSAILIKIKNIKRCQQEPSVCSCMLDHPLPPPWLGEGGVEIAWVHRGDSWYTSLFIVGMFALRFACFS